MDMESDMEVETKLLTEIVHPSGVTFHVYLTQAEVDRLNADTDFYEEMIHKYYEMYKDGIIFGHEVVQEKESEKEPSVATPETFHQSPRAWTGDHEEILINLVSERGPLWDFRLPLKERHRTKVKSLWEDIILQMNVDMTVDSITRKWKNIRDSYIRARSNVNKRLASGSSVEEKLQAEKLKRSHKNYELLSFLDGSLTTRSTTSNLEEADGMASPPAPTPSTSKVTPTQTPSSSRPTSRNQGELTKQDEMFLAAISNLPGPSELSPSQNFCLRLADGMDKLPPRVRNQLQVEFLTKLTEMENLYLYKE